MTLIHMSRVVAAIVVAVLAVPLIALAGQQKEVPRSIVSDDFVNKRPRARSKAKGHPPRRSRVYSLASAAPASSLSEAHFEMLQLGLTIWRLQPPTRLTARERVRQLERRAQRVAADTIFREGDLIRLSIESPRSGYLYVINRDWFSDGSTGETNLIFPIRGEDNRLEAGKLIDIPAPHQTPFKASPKTNQTGELLTIIVTSAPLRLPLSRHPLPLDGVQLVEWEEKWGSEAARYEMKDGLGQPRTIAERQAAAVRGMRQLTRDDPAPQTIYLLTPRSTDGLMFDLLLSYAR